MYSNLWPPEFEISKLTTFGGNIISGAWVSLSHHYISPSLLGLGQCWFVCWPIFRCPRDDNHCGASRRVFCLQKVREI